jgi:hypothetical protein
MLQQERADGQAVPEHGATAKSHGVRDKPGIRCARRILSRHRKENRNGKGKQIPRIVFLRCSEVRRDRSARRDGLLSLRVMPQPEAVEITQGADKVGTFNKTDRSFRKWCKSCGGHLYTVHPTWDVIDVYAASIPGFPFKAGVHVNYQETVLPMRDGLPKMRDYPAEMGGSGIVIPELVAA